jgi:hypothetical protein
MLPFKDAFGDILLPDRAVSPAAREISLGNITASSIP